MAETLLHVSETLTPERRDALCRALNEQGAGCETSQQSHKPHLIFIHYDEERASPPRLIETLSTRGFTARIVDV